MPGDGIFDSRRCHRPRGEFAAALGGWNLDIRRNGATVQRRIGATASLNRDGAGYSSAPA